MTTKSISKICSVDGCPQRKVRRLYCDKHYMRLRRHGSLEVEPQLSESYQVPFWARVETKPDDECWEWKLGVDKDGYGITSFHGHPTKAHRLAYYFTHGTWPELTRHTCDNPPCCNPHHLLSGTALDNSRDMQERQRNLRTKGSNNSKSVLTEADAKYIRDNGILFALGKGHGSPYSQRALAAKFGVTRRVIYLILTNMAWRHVT